MPGVRQPAMTRFLCPPSMQPHAAKVFAGEYDLPLDDVRWVLDVGANVGAYSVWARRRWPEVGIFAYEPDPRNAALYRQNEPDATLHEVAVCVEGSMPLYRGRHNCGEASLFPGEEHDLDDVVQVRCIAASDLGSADVLKVDTEGCELAIIAGYRHLETVRGVAYEWHSQRDREAIARILAAHGLKRLDDRQWAAERGVARWVR